MNRWLKARWHRFLGRRKLRSHRFQSALENFQRSAEQDPGSVQTSIEIGWCFYKLSDYQAAIDSYEQALQRQPDHASAHAYLALVLSKVQRPREAIDELRRALRINPNLKNRFFSNPAWENGFQSKVVGNTQSAIWKARSNRNRKTLPLTTRWDLRMLSSAASKTQ